MARKPRYICKICRRPASAITELRDDKEVVVGFVHIDRPSDGHEIQAVDDSEFDLDDIDQVCDFCNTPEVEWVFETDETIRPEDIGGMQVRDTAWAACDDCRAFIEDTSPDAKALANHVIDIHVGDNRFPEAFRPALVNQMLPLYSMFVRNRVGKAVPVREYFSS